MADNSKYYVHYVDNCAPTLKGFKTLKAARKFISDFKKKNRADDGYWVDYIIAGKVLDADEYYQEQL